MRQGRKKVVKLGAHLTSQVRRLQVKQKLQDLLQRGKHSNKRESQVKEERVHPEAQILRKLRGNEGVKNDQGEKGKRSLPHHQMF